MPGGIPHSRPPPLPAQDSDCTTSPNSPLTALVQRHLAHQRGVAVVHSCKLRSCTPESGQRSASQPSVRRAFTHTGAYDPHEHRAPSSARTSRPGSAASSSLDTGTINVGTADCLRELSTGEVTGKRRSVADWFHQAHAINERTHEKIDHVEAQLHEFRLRRASSTSTRASSKGSSDSESTTALAGRSSVRRHSPALRASTEPIVAMGKEMLGEANTPEIKGRVNLMEKFGYGVKPKTDNEALKRLGTAAGVASKPKNHRGMIEVKAGDNDLLARLQQRRSTVQ